MSNPGNKSTKRAPFTMFSSSAEGGYLTEFHENFKEGVQIANMHTDTYGDFRNPPMQGPFTEQFVGGAFFRHQPLTNDDNGFECPPGEIPGCDDPTASNYNPCATMNDGSCLYGPISFSTDAERLEGFNIDAAAGSLTISRPQRGFLYRDAFAKRPVNIRNIKKRSPGNYSQEYEVIQIAGRTLNPRHYAEYPEQYTTDYPLHMGTEGRVLNTLNAAGQPATGTLPDYTLPDNTGSLNEFIFVNKFSAPGDRYTMSRGFLNPKGEELSGYNASPFRNLNVKKELSADLATHTPKATDIPPASGTLYHTTNRNTRYYKQVSDAVASSVTPAGNCHQIAIDTATQKIYWTDYTAGTISRSNVDGAAVEELVSGISGPYGISLDTSAGKLYWAEYSGGNINRTDIEIPAGETPATRTIDNIVTGQAVIYAIMVAPHLQKVYWSSQAGLEIRAKNSDGSGDVTAITDSERTEGMQYDPVTDRIFFTKQDYPSVSGNIFSTLADGSGRIEILNFPTSIPAGLSVDGNLGQIYWTDKINGEISRANLDGSGLEELLDANNDPRGTALDINRGILYWASNDDQTLKRITLPYRPVYDDGYVTHAIPQSSLQYSWIKDSATTTRAEFQGFATGSDITFYPSTYDFMSMGTIRVSDLGPTQAVVGEYFSYTFDGFTLSGGATSWAPPDVTFTDGEQPSWMFYSYELSPASVTIWGTPPTPAFIRDIPMIVQFTDDMGGSDAKSETIEVIASHPYTTVPGLVPHVMNDVYIDEAAAVQDFDFTGSVYTYNSWKEIRGGELALSRYYRNHNILPVANMTDKVKQYIEPPVVANNQPLDYILAIDNTGTPYNIRSAYGSKLQRYSNTEINKLANVTISDAGTEYSKIKPLYLERSTSDTNNPVKAFYSLTYGQAVYPQSKNAFMKKVRIRGKYTEVPGTGENGYDRLYGTQRTFYSATEQRSEGALNSQGCAPTEFSTQEVYAEDFGPGTEWANYSPMISRDNTSGIAYDNTSGSYCFIFGGQQNAKTETRYISLKQPVIGAFTASFKAVSHPYSPLNLTPSTLGVDSRLVVVEKDAVVRPTSDIRRTTYCANKDSGWTADLTGPGWTSFSYENYYYSPTNIIIMQPSPQFVDYSEATVALKDLEISYTPATDLIASDAFAPMGTSGDKSFYASGTFDENIGELNSDTDITTPYKKVQTSIAYSEEVNNVINHIFPGQELPSTNSITEADLAGEQISFGYTERLTEEISGLTPAYSSYEDYAENEKHAIKEASILPEFRISEQMPFYVEQNGGNFRKENKKFLTLLGAEYSASADSAASVAFDPDFAQAHLLSEGVPNLKKIREDHIGHSKPRRISLTAKGVKKLLPYNGFYPDTRTVQLANTLSSSLAAGIKSYVYDSLTAADSLETERNDATGWFGFLKTMMSPGILHNSLKGGIAVDYPVFGSPVNVEGRKHDSAFGDVKLLDAPDTRISFDSLYNLKKNLPVDTPIYTLATSDKLQDKKDTYPFYFKWDGTKKPSFELGMHNFLAESVKFFLKGSELNSFLSSPTSDFGAVVPYKKYYMDVVLDDATQRNKFLNVKGQANQFANFLSTTPKDDQLPFSTFYGHATDICPDGYGGYYAMVGAPWYYSFPIAPPDLWGMAILYHVDSSNQRTEVWRSTAADANNSESWLGTSVAVISGSDGVFFGAGATRYNDGTYTNGYAKFWKYDGNTVSAISPGGFGLPWTTVQNATKFGVAMKGYYDETVNIPYFAVADLGTSVGGTDASGLNLFAIDDPGGTPEVHWKMWQNFDYTENNISVELNYGMTDLAIQKVEFSSSPSDNRLIILHSATAYRDNATHPNYSGSVQAVLWDETTSAGTALGPYVDPIGPIVSGPMFGSNVSVVETYNNGSTAKGIVSVSRGSDSSLFNSTGSQALFCVDFAPANFSLDPADADTRMMNVAAFPQYTNPYGYGGTLWGVSADLQKDPDNGDIILVSGDPYYYSTGSWGGYNLAGAVELQRFPVKFFDEDGVPYYFPTGSLADLTTLQDFMDVSTQNPKLGYPVATTMIDDKLHVHAGAVQYSGSLSAGGMACVLYEESREQDYRQDGKLFGFPLDGYYDPAYCTYTPPGFYGESIARLSFSSATGGDVDLEEILENMQVEHLHTLAGNRIQTITGSHPVYTTTQDEAQTTVSSSVDLFGKVTNPGMEFSVSEDGALTRADRATPATAGSARWAISTKFECPVVNVSSSLYRENYSTFNNQISSSVALSSSTVSYDPPQSTWTSYTENPPTENYTFSLRDSFDLSTVSSNTGSLIDLCGFTPGDKQVGSLADQKTISEAIMVIPYTSRPIRNKTIKLEDGMYFFKVGKRELKRQRKSMEDNGYAISEEVPVTSISEAIDAMKNYVIPPQYNFVKYDDLSPFVAYFLKFEHSLNQDDLKKVWQGISPSIAVTPETDEVDISHDIDKHNFFYDINIPNDIKFMIFKVKQKAEWNYYNVTTDSTDDDRFRFDFQGNGQVEVVPDYSYNWPYDYFSLVERAKVSVNFTLKKDEEDTE